MLALAILDDELELKLETCYEIGRRFDIRSVSHVNSSGNYLIWLTEYYPKGNGDFFKANILYRLILNSSTGTFSFERDTPSLKVYPNPVNGFIMQIEEESYEDLALKVESKPANYLIRSADGKVLAEGPIIVSDLIIPVGNLSSGHYYLEVYDEDSRQVALTNFVKK